MDGVQVVEHIGDGAHGHVLKGFNEKTNKFVALKKIRLKKSVNDIPISVLREINILLTIDCDYVST